LKVDRGEIVSLVELTLGRDGVRPSDRLLEDLGLESTDMLNLLNAVDDRFGIFVDELEAFEISTVADLGDLLETKAGEG
jgi:acyl carrier protein